MELKKAFAIALRTLRRRLGFTQEDFSIISSRTYMSTLERGMKSPTLEKIDALSVRMDLHPLTLLACCYSIQENRPPQQVIAAISKQLADLDLRLPPIHPRIPGDNPEE